MILLFWWQISAAQDSTSFFKKIPNIFPQGNIALGYDYGYLPFLVQNNPPIGNFKTNGNFQIQLKSLPFQGSFYYSSLGTISGLNNHFTIRFDAPKYKQQMLKKLKRNELDRIQSIDSLGKVKQKLKTKLDYLYLVKDQKISLPIDSSKYHFPNRHDLDLPDLSHDLDTLTPELNTPDSLMPNVTIDTSKAKLPVFNKDQYLDSIGDEISKLQNVIGEVNQRMTQLKELNSLSQDSLMQLEVDKTQAPWMRKINSFMSNVQRLDIGLTYPNYSQFLVSKIPVRGLNLEYQKKQLFFAFTHGKTVNNIFFTNNVIQNNLNAARNLYNFFDFNNINDGRRVTAVKLGIGQKNNTHFHIGMLYGLGKVSYQDTSLIVDKEKNLVVELDGGIRIKKRHYLTLNYGRSAIQVNSVNFGDDGNLLDNLMDINDRTNAILSRYQLKLDAAELLLTFRWIDPYFRSFGVGFLRSDNIRYELKYKQNIGKKVSFNGYFRRENDNLLGLYNYQNVLLSYGLGITYRPTKHLMLKADVRPIVLDANSAIDSLSVSNDNLILNGVLNYSNRIGETYINTSGIYSYYRLTFDESLQIYQNINLNLTIENHNFANSLIFNRYQTTDTSSVPLASLVQNDLTYRFNKFSLTGTLKGSFTQNQEFDFGYGIKFIVIITKSISIGGGFEKLVIGDFYNSVYNSSQLNYPYRATSSLVFKW